MVTVPFRAFADSSREGIVERHVQCAQSPMHFVESAAPSGSSRLHSSMNFGSSLLEVLTDSQNNSFDCCCWFSMKQKIT